MSHTLGLTTTIIIQQQQKVSVAKDVEELELLYMTCWWGCKTVQPLES